MASSKQAKITDEHREEARRLLALWMRKKPELVANGYGTQEKFGAKFEIGNQAAVGFFLNGKTALSPKAAKGFAVGLGCRVADFSPRLAKLLESPTGDSTSGGADFVAAAAVAVARRLDALPQERQKATLAKLLQVLRASERNDVPTQSEPSPQPKLSRAQPTKTARAKSRAAP